MVEPNGDFTYCVEVYFQNNYFLEKSEFLNYINLKTIYESIIKNLFKIINFIPKYRNSAINIKKYENGMNIQTIFDYVHFIRCMFSYDYFETYGTDPEDYDITDKYEFFLRFFKEQITKEYEHIRKIFQIISAVTNEIDSFGYLNYNDKLQELLELILKQYAKNELSKYIMDDVNNIVISYCFFEIENALFLNFMNI